MAKVFFLVRDSGMGTEEVCKYHDEIPNTARERLIYGVRLDTLPGGDLSAASCAGLYERYKEARDAGCLPEPNIAPSDYYTRK